ncbi:reticulon-4 receptor [Plakobranchus ocellatus]|uniref:Reticulon-4 receptor n=1 Tax=Plakobranchus ocellatus TaxID=259542 RepID=A0AAV3ZAS5_9GAST|nr:reticulon-4 receptor [Plakobranchus ocellatus]
MKHLKELHLVENHISAIENDGFKGATKLTMINLRRNLIKRIPKNTFNGADLPQVQDIYLHNNHLRSIASETFCNMTLLSYIDLRNNKIAHISQDAFKGLTKLEILLLTRNLLTSTAWIIGNANSFQNLNLLVIEYNRLKTLSTNLLDSLPKTSYLRLAENPWICDLSLKLVYDAWMVRRNRKTDLSGWSCQIPRKPNQRKKVSDLSNETLEMLSFAEDFHTHTKNRDKVQPSKGSPRIGHSQSPLVIMICTCTGVFGLVR